MRQLDAVEAISKSLKKDSAVKAIFVKGSIGRGEFDEQSDVDLYCLVEDTEVEEFLTRRMQHLGKYREILFYEDLFIIAPQVIVVYDNLLHVDLFTVTETTFKKKDYFKVIYDPDNRLKPFKEDQNLLLSEDEFDTHTYDLAWFLFQYSKARKRGNDFWAIEMLNFAMPNLAKILLHRYEPNRAQLGIKTLQRSLPIEVSEKLEDILNNMTPTNHQKGVALLVRLLKMELSWIEANLLKESQSRRFIRFMIEQLDT
ncbi:nucleotidyltransferase domain-containing protein [Alkalihalobacillus sp. 1P02AB]|uniref:nucleotidyltransferase domain-containing protein n=1 Tax=Alkalihalobacillus sp. 1P02AB TaxID=3132260 RepID=UPI0039A67A88